MTRNLHLRRYTKCQPLAGGVGGGLQKVLMPRPTHHWHYTGVYGLKARFTGVREIPQVAMTCKEDPETHKVLADTFAIRINIFVSENLESSSWPFCPGQAGPTGSLSSLLRHPLGFTSFASNPLSQLSIKRRLT